MAVLTRGNNFGYYEVTGSPDGTYNTGDPINLEINPFGETMRGFQISSDNTTYIEWGNGVTINMPNYDIVVTPILVFQIRYSLYGGTNNPNNPGTYDLTQLPITLQAPTRNGYTFLGWDGDNVENPPQLNYTIPIGTYGHIEYEARWSPTKYKVYHIIERANQPGVYTLYEVEHLEGIPGQYTNAQPKNYPGFYQDGTITQKIIAADGSTDVYIGYTRYNYTINFDSNGGSSVASITAKYGAPLTPPSDPVKPGDSFIGWVPSFPTDMPLGGAYLVATWNNRGIKGIMMNGKYIIRKYILGAGGGSEEVQKVMLNGKKIRPL